MSLLASSRRVNTQGGDAGLDVGLLESFASIITGRLHGNSGVAVFFMVGDPHAFFELLCTCSLWWSRRYFKCGTCSSVFIASVSRHREGLCRKDHRSFGVPGYPLQDRILVASLCFRCTQIRNGLGDPGHCYWCGEYTSRPVIHLASECFRARAARMGMAVLRVGPHGRS